MSQSTELPDPDPEQLRLAVERLLDETVDRDDSLHVSAEELDIAIPMSFGADAQQATWRFDGDMTVTLNGIRGPLREWVALLEESDSSE